MSPTAPAFNRSEEITLSSQMLFPPQAKAKTNAKGTIHLLTDKQAKKQQDQQAEIEKREMTNIIMGWNYRTDRQIQFHQQQVLALQKTTYVADVTPKSTDQSEYLEIQPRAMPTDPLILTTREALLVFLERAPAIVRQQAKIESVHGQIAGSLLWYMYHMKHCNLAGPSLKSAKIICETHYPHRFTSTRGRSKKNEHRLIYSYKSGTLSAAWKNFGSVAHLWAALLALNDDDIKPTDMPLENIDLPRFIWYAKIFATFGSNYFSRNSPNKKPILDCDSLVTPPLEPSGDIATMEQALINPDVKQYMQKIIKEKGLK